jgi:GNAT superfamily N-acetyltransferase
MVRIQIEKFSKIYNEAMPLFEDHYREISARKDIPLSPNIFQYNRMENDGAFVFFTARDKGALIAYVAFFIHPHMHYSTSLQAYQDVFYVSPKYRGQGLGERLIQASDGYLRDRGVQMIYHHVKTYNDFGPLLERNNYFHFENIYAKKL